MTNLIDAALDYVARGFKIFPCVPKGKEPATGHWIEDATNDVEQIRRWWGSNPEYNIGLPTGKANGIVVIDCDIHPEVNEDGYRDFCEYQKENGDIPDTVLSITQSGGYHFIYKTDKDYRNRVKVYGSIDIRANNGYIVVPPSVGKNGEYCWECGYGIDEFEMAEANEVIDKLINIKNEGVLTAGLPAELGEGQRNELLFKEGCRLRGVGYKPDEIENALNALNNSRCNPPLSLKDIHIIAESVSKYEEGKKINTEVALAENASNQSLPLDIGKGGMIQSITNAYVLISQTDKLTGRIGFNELTGSIYCMDYMPWKTTGNSYREFGNADYPQLYLYMEKYGFRKIENINHALSAVADNNRFNPITEMLDDIFINYGTCRGYVDKLLPKYMGVEDTEYHRELIRKFMLGAVARAYEPGVKFDSMLVFTGKQGAGKSTFFRRLAMDDRFYNENLSVADSDKAVEKIRGMWICEMAELSAMKKAKDIESVKAFITTTVDQYRAPYARVKESCPRRCVLVGTTNNSDFLTDPTGSRRFWVVEVHKDKVSDDIRETLVNGKCLDDFKMAWGEIVAQYKSGDYTLELEKSVAIEAEEFRERFEDEDAMAAPILSWLEINKPVKTCPLQIMCKVFNEELSIASSDRAKIARVRAIVDNFAPEYERARVRMDAPYGNVRGWKRKDEFTDAKENPFD